VLDISQRLSIAKMVASGKTVAAIKQETGVSTATISRIKKCWDYGTGGYKMIIDRCKGKDND
jgi:TrpR-related protein YerC/YecD